MSLAMQPATQAETASCVSGRIKCTAIPLEKKRQVLRNNMPVTTTATGTICSLSQTIWPTWVLR